jgi:hypothetical protein
VRTRDSSGTGGKNGWPGADPDCISREKARPLDNLTSRSSQKKIEPYKLIEEHIRLYLEQKEPTTSTVNAYV